MAEAFEGHRVRVVGTPDAPEWIAQDVCDAIGLKDAHGATKRFEAEETGRTICPGNAGDRTVVTVTEPGLYRLIFRSNKDEAKRFQTWVFHEVLPRIRKTGSYSVGPEPTAPPEPPELLAARARLALVQVECETANPQLAILLASERVFASADGAPEDLAMIRAATRAIILRVTGQGAPAAAPSADPCLSLPADGRATVLELARYHRRSLTDTQASRVGRIACDLYYERHGRKPQLESRVHRGRVQTHSVYAEPDHELVIKALVEILDAEPFPKQINGGPRLEMN